MPASPAFPDGVRYSASGMSDAEGKAQEKAPASRLALIRHPPPWLPGFAGPPLNS